MGERRVGAERAHNDVEHLLEARLGVGGRQGEACELVVAIAFADAEIEAPARQEIEGRDLLGQQHRIVPRQHQDRRAEPQPRRARREVGQQRERGGELADLREVMLGHEARMKSRRVGLDGSR